MQRREQVIATAALALAGALAVVVVIGVVRALRSPGTWVLASSAAVLMAAAVSQWVAVRARARGARLLPAELVLLLALAVLALALCGLDFVTGTRDNRAFTVLFAAGLIVVVGGVVGSYRLQRAGEAEGESSA